MKALIPILIGLLVVGCGKDSDESTNRMEGPIGDALRWKAGKEGFTKESLAEIKSANLSRIIVPKDITDLSPLESLPNLQTLDLRRQQKINDFSPLSKLKELQELTLDGTGISDLKPLTGLRKLTKLQLSQNMIADLSPLSELTQLTYLTLTDNKITNEQLKHLSQMKNLKFLSIANTPHIGNDNKITNLEPLLGLEKLDEVLIMNLAGLSDEEVSKLEEALPGCTIRR